MQGGQGRGLEAKAAPNRAGTAQVQSVRPCAGPACSAVLLPAVVVPGQQLARPWGFWIKGHTPAAAALRLPAAPTAAAQSAFGTVRRRRRSRGRAWGAHGELLLPPLRPLRALPPPPVGGPNKRKHAPERAPTRLSLNIGAPQARGAKVVAVNRLEAGAAHVLDGLCGLRCGYGQIPLTASIGDRVLGSPLVCTHRGAVWGGG